MTGTIRGTSKVKLYQELALQSMKDKMTEMTFLFV